MNIQKNSLNTHNISFSGHKKALDKTGYEQHNFYYLYDFDKYDCEVELFNIAKDKKGNISIKEKDKPAASLNMRDGGINVDMFDVPEIYSDLGFAYRFKLTDKNTKKVSYAFDNGSVIGIFDKRQDNKYNVVLNNRATIERNGAMQLIMPDEYYPGVVNKDGKPTINESLRNNALASVRNHANRLGGNFYGIIKRLPEISKEGVKRIVGTPFTKDLISSHLYWTANAYQISPNLGSEEDFKIFQQELFKNDINWVADAALVNEGFCGIHFSELLRKGEDSFSKNMFRSDEKISLGILPSNCSRTRMKIINAPFSLGKDGTYTDKNKNYNPSKPTYIQFYDDALASNEQKKSDSPKRMTTYDNKNTDNIYDITHHDDAVYPFPLEVDPAELKMNARKIAKKGAKIDLSNLETIKKISNFSNFNVVEKTSSGGLEVWDGNVDIAKLNFFVNNKDNERFQNLPPDEREEAISDYTRGTLAVKDYAVNMGKYWTKFTADSQLQYVVSSLKTGEDLSAEEYMSLIQKLVDSKAFPSAVLERVDTEVIDEVLNNNYHQKKLDEDDMRSYINPESKEHSNDYTVSDYIMRKSMELPLETLPFGNNILGIMTSPYIQKKANIEEEIGVSRYDLAKADNPNLPDKYRNVYSQVDEIYENEITPIIYEIVKDIPGISENGNVTDYGKYVISEAAPDVTRYILTKSIAPKSDIIIERDGHINLSKVDDEEITMQSLNIPYSGKTLEEESQMLVNAIEKGISNLDDKDLDSIKYRLENKYSNISLNDFKIGEMILDKTESGLGWRIDASKDVASIDSVRADYMDMNDAFRQVTDFWSMFNQSVLKENPHSYSTAEITDLADLMTKKEGALYENAGDAERKFLQETGITSIANYNYFFSLLPSLFGNFSFEDGHSNWQILENNNSELGDKLDTGWEGNPGFLFQSPDDGVVNSYNFAGNHDKPRVLHCLALDMGLFHSDFDKNKKPDKPNNDTRVHRKIAAEVLQKDESEIDFDTVSSEAVAMGSRLNLAFDEKITDKKLNAQLKEAVANIASGKYKDKNFDAYAFGTREIPTAIKSVFDEAERTNNIKIPNRKALEAEVFKSIIVPAYERYESMYKLMTVLPGSPTDFAGDRTGSTGYETKAKNYDQQNRNTIHWEWLENGDYKYIKTAYDILNKTADLRKKLPVLNDGSTVSVPVYTIQNEKIDEKNTKEIFARSKQVQSFLRYNDKGSVAIILTNNSGAEKPYNKEMERGTTIIGNKIFLDFNYNNAKQGLKHGMKPGTRLKSDRESDNTVYKIDKIQINDRDYYYLKRENAQGNPVAIDIQPEDYNTLILYKE